MFGLFKKKSQREVLEVRYRALLEESFKLSIVNRAESDKKRAEAEDVLKRMEALPE